MKIAFVGKGGSGKSTLAALFIRYLVEQKFSVLAIDADINVHLASLLGIEHQAVAPLSNEVQATAIRSYLKGTNKRIKNLDSFVKTTPPAEGSNFLTFDTSNPIIQNATAAFAENARYAHVGTYQTGDIGSSCYHGHLAVFENLLSHSKLNRDEWLVADMVAGVDAFANSLHAQFDAIVLVVEPTHEGVALYAQYKRLAQGGGVWDRILLVGNKIEDADDAEYLERNLDDPLIGSLPINSRIKKDRQQQKPLSLDVLSPEGAGVLSALTVESQKRYREPNEQLQKLIALHLTFSNVGWVKASHGNLSHQADVHFRL